MKGSVDVLVNMNSMLIVGTQPIFNIIKSERVITTKGPALLDGNQEKHKLMSDEAENTCKNC